MIKSLLELAVRNFHASLKPLLFRSELPDHATVSGSDPWLYSNRDLLHRHRHQADAANRHHLLLGKEVIYIQDQLRDKDGQDRWTRQWVLHHDLPAILHHNLPVSNRNGAPG